MIIAFACKSLLILYIYLLQRNVSNVLNTATFSNDSLLLIQVVCGKCSKHQAPLAYDDNKMSRVCYDCYDVLRKRGFSTNGKSEDSGTDTPPLQPAAPNLTMHIQPSVKKILKVVSSIQIYLIRKKN